MISTARAAFAAGFTAVIILLLVSFPRTAPAQGPPADLLRGDANFTGKIDLSDPIFILNFLFSGGPAPPCIPTADANARRGVDISDAIYLLTYLFSSPVELVPLTEAEREQCGGPPPPPTVLRRGTLLDVSEPPHGVRGTVEQLSDGTLRATHFYYDGQGVPMVVFLLQKVDWFPTFNWQTNGENRIISHDLITEQRAFADETMEFSIPSDFTEFKYVSVFCTDQPLTYGYARLFDVE